MSHLSFNGTLKVQTEIKAERLESANRDHTCFHYPPPPPATMLDMANQS